MFYVPVLEGGVINVPKSPEWHDFLQLHRESWNPPYKSMLTDVEHILTSRYVLPNGDPMLRSSRSPIVSHLLGTAMVAYWLLSNDPVAVLAALLHDIVEDFPTDFSVSLIAALTTNEIADIVNGLTKHNPEFYDEHVFHASVKEPRVGLIKLGDFSQNVVTLDGFEPRKRWEWIQKVTRQYLPMFDRITEYVPVQTRDRYLALLAQTTSTLGREREALLAISASRDSFVELALPF